MTQIQTEEEGETLREETLVEPWIRILALCHPLTVCSCTRDSPLSAPHFPSLEKENENILGWRIERDGVDGKPLKVMKFCAIVS